MKNEYRLMMTVITDKPIALEDAKKFRTAVADALVRDKKQKLAVIKSATCNYVSSGDWQDGRARK